MMLRRPRAARPSHAHERQLAPPVVLLASLGRLRTALPVRLTTAAMVLRPRRILRLRCALRARRTLRARCALWVWLTATTATAELARRRLLRTTGSRTLHRVVHLVALIDVRLDATRSWAAYGRTVVVSHRWARRLPVPAASRTTGPAARAATNCGAASGPRRPVVSSDNMIRATVTWAAVVSGVNIWPASRCTVLTPSVNIRSVCRCTVLIPGVNIRPASRPTVLSTAVVGRTSSPRGNHPSA